MKSCMMSSPVDWIRPLSGAVPGQPAGGGLATVEYCRKVYEKLPPPIPRFANPQRYRNMIRQIKQNPEAFPSSIFHEQLNPSRASSPNGMPLPKTQQETQQMMKRLLEQSDDDSQQLTQLLQRGETSSPSGRAICPRLGGVQIVRCSGRLAASEQKLAESTQWLEMMGLSLESDQSRYSSLSSGETGTLPEDRQNPKLKQIAKLNKLLSASVAVRRKMLWRDNHYRARQQPVATGELQSWQTRRYFHCSLLATTTARCCNIKHPAGKAVAGPHCLPGLFRVNGWLPDTWAKVALLSQIAHQDNRHLVIHFGTRVYRSDDFPPSQHHDYQRLLESMLSFTVVAALIGSPSRKRCVYCNAAL